jgi:hypothetical protein
MARQLKVYHTHLSFYDMIVAAPSQKAAAQAWGATPDLFARGFAEVTTDPQLVEAALSKPGVVLRRQFGSSGKFSEDEGSLRPPMISPKESAAQRKREQRAAANAKRAERQAARERAHEAAAAKRAARAEHQSALKRQRKEVAADREKRHVARARAKAEATRRRDEERDAAKARRDLQSHLNLLLRQRKDRLRDIEHRENALASERRKIGQSFDARILALQKELKEA